VFAHDIFSCVIVAVRASSLGAVKQHPDLMNGFAAHFQRRRAFANNGKNYDDSEATLELFSVCGAKFVQHFFRGGVDVIDFIEEYQHSYLALCSFLICYVYVAVPHFYLKALVRNEQLAKDGGDEIVLLLIHFNRLFASNNKHNYALLVFRYLILLQTVHLPVKHLLLSSLSLSMSGNPQSAQALDLVNERVRVACRDVVIGMLACTWSLISVCTRNRRFPRRCLRNRCYCRPHIRCLCSTSTC
jgi:hypothetical protein